ncbi:MAG: PilZ domain-containing protein [Deltaproteobacteria bacterium]|nr:PilZ domain-containing protein [Deltaproteobacteria bacterium]MBW2151745.1 PilZ domain-containing protein [Deltaproteobacteria bacterium]
MTERKFQEKREFVRADFSIRASVKLLDRSAFESRQSVKRLLSSYRNPYPGQTVDRDEAYTESMFSDLTGFLIQINEKLDRIISLIGADKQEPNSIEVKETLNISGSGVSLIVGRAVEVGQLLDISLNIPTFPMGVFKTQGEIIRVTPHADGHEDLFEVGIRFLNLTDDERERLIGYIFSQQRRNIREQKSYL